jgi:hypothetical protein
MEMIIAYLAMQNNHDCRGYEKQTIYNLNED